MKIKHIKSYDIQDHLSSIRLIYSDNKNYCRVVKIGKFLQFSEHSTGKSEAD